MLHFNILDAEQGSAVQTLLPYRLHHICALRIIKSGDILQTHIDQTVYFHISNQELDFHFSEISNQELAFHFSEISNQELAFYFSEIQGGGRVHSCDCCVSSPCGSSLGMYLF